MSQTTPPLWKQILGAVGGAAVALMLYTAWHAVSPHVSAWLIVPPTESPEAIVLSDPADKTQKEFERIARRAREIADTFGTLHAASEISEEPMQKEAVESEPTPVVEPAPVVMEEEIEPAMNDVMAEEAIEVMPTEEAAPPAPVYEPPVITEAVAPALPSSGLGVVLITVFVLGALAGILHSRGWFALSKEQSMQ